MLQRHKTQSLKQNVKSILKYSTEFHQTCVKHSRTRIDENRMVKNYQSTMPNGQLWYFMSYAIMDRATLLNKHSYLLCLKFPKLGPRLIIFEQSWQRLLQNQQQANSEVLTLSSSWINLSCFSMRRDGTVGIRSSPINCFCFRVLILKETSVNSWLVTSSPGCHSPNLEGDISASLVCSCTLAIRMSCLKKALTPANTRSPQILRTDRSSDWQETENMATWSKSLMSSGRCLMESDDFPEGSLFDWYTTR